ncbi:MAG: TetR/AcrR family transcriptional regulator [Vicinamibacterales bacterium]|jgi:AcrR family transcriptional regulator|nr:TetR/AcrR family transcriptional regulator [Vicinamibacterales bacterium]
MTAPKPDPPAHDDALKPLGRRARKAMAVRQSLVAAGLEAFERQPIGLVSILDITEAADVAKGVFYLHFKSKDEYLLALWEDVQRMFLDNVRAAVVECRSRTARVEEAIRQFYALATENPAAARFWIRMSSYFPDEVGEPGHLTRIHQEYVQQLAAIFAGRTFDQLGPDDVRSALLADSICWAVANTSVTTGEPLCSVDVLVRIVASAIKTANRG